MELMAKDDTHLARVAALQYSSLEVDNHCVVVNEVGLCRYRLVCLRTLGVLGVVTVGVI